MSAEQAATAAPGSTTATAATAPAASAGRVDPSVGSDRGGLSARPLAPRRATPEVLRQWSVVVAALCIAFGVVGSVVAGNTQRATERIRDNTGPVLVTTQSVLASLAEADAAAVAAQVNPADPRPRRAYLDAIARTNEQLEDVSALIGDDPPAHAALKDINVAVTGYTGLVESARTAQLFDDATAQGFLAQAGDRLSGDLARAAGRLEDATLARLEADDVGALGGRAIAIALGIVALTVLLVVQLRLTGRVRRLVNPGLAVATVLTLVALVWQVAAISSARSSFTQARDDGFQSLLVTSQVQSTGFGALRDELVAQRSGDLGLRAAADATAEQLAGGSSTGTVSSNDGLLVELVATADSARERATAVETLERWRRYRIGVQQVRALGNDQTVSALVSAFNGFTFSVEAVLGDNRDQFLLGLEDATGAVQRLALWALILPLLAAAAALGGLQVRINEYR